jgi:hypothetical protein
MCSGNGERVSRRMIERLKRLKRRPKDGKGGRTNGTDGRKRDTLKTLPIFDAINNNNGTDKQPSPLQEA